ncbi:MAG: hypothetical protein ACRDSL_11160 [Pseudonocardiaceae bacterium]
MSPDNRSPVLSPYDALSCAGAQRGVGGLNLILDAGALIAIDRDDRRVAGLIELGRRAGASLVIPAPVVAQAWRGGARQARLARYGAE